MDRQSEFMRLLGNGEAAEYDEAAQKLSIRFKVNSKFCYAGEKQVLRGYSAAWIDAAMAQLISRASYGEYGAATLEMKLNYIQPVVGNFMTAEACIEKLGRSIAFLEGRLVDEQSNILVVSSSTVMLAKARQ